MAFIKNFYKKYLLNLFILTTILFCLITASFTNTVKGAEKYANPTLAGNLDILMDIPSSIITPYINTFMEKYPKVSIKYEYCSAPETMTEIIRSGRDFPDIISLPENIDSSEYYSYFLKYGDLNVMQQKYKYMSLAAIDGNSVYGMPAYAVVSGFIYNKKVFDKAGIKALPQTPNEFLDALRAISLNTDATPMYVNFTNDKCLKYWSYFPFIEMTGDPEYKYNTFLYTRNPFSEGQNIYSVYNILFQAVKKGYTERTLDNGSIHEAAYLLNYEKIGCMAGGTDLLETVLNSNHYNSNIGFMPFPNFVNGKQYSTIFSGPKYAINSKTDNPDTAKAFIKFMLDESGLAENTKNVSLKKGSHVDNFFQDFSNTVITSSYTPGKEAAAAYDSFISAVNFESPAFIRKIALSALKLEKKTFIQIMNDANLAWESKRSPEYAPTKISSEKAILADTSTTSALKVSLSKSELNYIYSHPIIKVAYVDGNKPYIYKENGIIKGLTVDILAMIEKETGIGFHFTEYKNRTQAVNALSQGYADMTVYEPDKMKVKRQTNSYNGYTLMLIHGNKFSYFNIKNSTEVRVNGQTYFYDSGVHKTIYADNPKDAVQFIYEGKADYVLLNGYIGSCLLSGIGSGMLVSEPVSMSGEVSFGVSSHASPVLLSILNKYLAAMPKTYIESLLLTNMEVLKGFSLIQHLSRHPLQMLIITLIFMSFIISIVLLVAFLLIRASKYRAEHDPLTGIYNRDGLQACLTRVLKHEDITKMAFFILDLDNFKSVNDTLGHGGGDAVLSYLAEVLNQFNDAHWIPARIGGDEFVVISCNQNELFLRRRIEHVIRQMDREFPFEGNTHHISSSCGGVLYNRQINFEEGYKAADEVLYKKKKAGKNGYYLVLDETPRKREKTL